jgi:hypothetical protein
MALRPLALVLAVVLGACSRSSRANPVPTGLELTWTLEPTPAVVGPARLTLSFIDANGDPAEVQSVNVRGDMTHAGMVPVLAQAEGLAQGRFTIAWEWPMAGEWIFTVEAVLPDGRHAVHEIELSVEAAP